MTTSQQGKEPKQQVNTYSTTLDLTPHGVPMHVHATFSYTRESFQDTIPGSYKTKQVVWPSPHIVVDALAYYENNDRFVSDQSVANINGVDYHVVYMVVSKHSPNGELSIRNWGDVRRTTRDEKGRWIRIFNSAPTNNAQQKIANAVLAAVTEHYNANRPAIDLMWRQYIYEQVKDKAARLRAEAHNIDNLARDFVNDPAALINPLN